MKARVLSSLFGIPIVLLAIAAPHPGALFGLVIAAAMVGLSEWETLFSCSREDSSDLLPALGSLAVLFGAGMLFAAQQKGFADLGIEPREGTLLILGSAFWVTGLVAATLRAKGARDPATDVLGTMWFVAPLAALVFWHPGSLEQAGSWSLQSPLTLLFVSLWAGDIAGMLAGKAFGRRLFAPRISPKKTWEGAIANFLAAGLAGLGLGALLGYSPSTSLTVGLAIGVFGQAGDLFESGLKRAAGTKDSGTILPGHGGILDRLDSLFASVFPVWAILYFSQ
jgi:phosphatidate cytidylyltransferase